MFFRQPAKLAFIESITPSPWNTTSAGANHAAIITGSSSAMVISTSSARVVPANAAMASGSPRIMVNAPALVVFQGEGVIDSMKASFAGCLKNIVPFLVYGVVFFLLALVAMIPIGLGWLVLGPMLSASVYTSYRDIYLRPR